MEPAIIDQTTVLFWDIHEIRKKGKTRGMSCYIITYTGKHIDPLEPEKEALCVEDIAHALSLICRGNGQVKSFFSVGQHCINCAREAYARGLSARMCLAALLHDASECYMSDVPRPLKQVLPEYQQQEAQLLSVIYERFLGSDLSVEEHLTLKEIDDAMLWYDMKHLLEELSFVEKPGIHIRPDYEVRPFVDVEQEYLELFEQFYGALGLS